ncbi:MAG: response regulator transcription factor [Chloroflexi bacterium]|nr:response regulator transcription factor [Chloroflexota bacterium]
MKITFRRRQYRTRQTAASSDRISKVSTKVMIAARSARFIDTLADSVNKNPCTLTIGGAQDGDTAAERMVLLRPDVVIIDIDLGYELGGIDTAFALRKINPTIGIVIVSPYSDPERLAMIPTGLGLEWSYVLTATARNPELIARAIQGASWGIPYIDERIDRSLLGVVENSVDAILDRILEGSTKERRSAALESRGRMFRWNGRVQTFRIEDSSEASAVAQVPASTEA